MPNRAQRRATTTNPGLSHCHKKIKEVAIGLAGATYEMLMSSDNESYRQWKKSHPLMNAKQLEREFVRVSWSKHIIAARTTLALLLREPLDDAIKEEIVEALTLDATLLRGRRPKGSAQAQVGEIE